MSEVTAFKVAFLTRCAEEGLTVDQIHERVKTALAKAEAKFGLEKQAVPGVGTAIHQAAKTLGSRLALGTGLGALALGIAPKVYDSVAAPMAAAGQAYLQSDGSIPAAIYSGAGAGALENYGKVLIPGFAAGLAGLGLLAGKHMATTQEDPLAAEQIKHQELLNEYDRLAKRVSVASKRRKLLENRG